MNFEGIDFRQDPEEVCKKPFDCIWIWFKTRRNPTPLENPLLQWIDWRMQGVLSQYVMDSGATRDKTTFFPSMNKIASSYVALEPSQARWEHILRNCEGLKFHHVLFITEDEARGEQIRQHLTKHKQHDFPQVVSVAEG